MSVTVESILKLPSMKDAEVICSSGLHNTVEYVTIAEAPEIRFPNYNQGVFVLTTLSAYRESVEKQNTLIEGLCKVNVAMIGIKIGRFIDKIDPSTIEIVQKYCVPLITLPPTVFFRDIISEALSAITGNQKVLLNQINAMNEALLDSIVHNKNIQDILTLLCSRIDCYCCCILPPQEKIAEVSSLDASVDEKAVSTAFSTFFSNPQYGTAASFEEGISIYPCIVQDRLLAAVCIVTHNVEPELLQPLAQTVVNGISIKLLERDLEEQAARGVVASLMDDILFSPKVDSNLAYDRLTSLNFTPYKNILILVLAGSTAVHELTWLHIVGNVQSVFSRRFQSALAFKRGPECVVFLSYETDLPPVKLRKMLTGCLDELETLEQKIFFIGCSTVAQNLCSMSEYYNQAKKAITYGQIVHPQEKIALYLDYYEMGLVSYGIASSEAKLLEDQIIRPILEYDRKTKSELWHTLEIGAMAKTLDQAAKDLHIHISTLRYRLQKIEQITSYNFIDQNDRIKLYLAYIMYKISGNKGY